jgi:hypothetical protein
MFSAGVSARLDQWHRAPKEYVPAKEFIPNCGVQLGPILGPFGPSSDVSSL